MTRSSLRPAALAAVVLLALVAPASAVAIHHTNRAAGDPDAASRPSGHAAPPADTSGPSYFDKLHESGNHG